LDEGAFEQLVGWAREQTKFRGEKHHEIPVVAPTGHDTFYTLEFRGVVRVTQ